MLYMFLIVHQGGSRIVHTTTTKAITRWKEWVWKGRSLNSVFRIKGTRVEEMEFDGLGRVRWTPVIQTHGDPNVEDVPSYVR